MGIFGGTFKGVQWPLQVTFEGTEGRHNLGCGPKWPDIFNSNEIDTPQMFYKVPKMGPHPTQLIPRCKREEVHAIVFTLILLSFKHNCISDNLIYLIHRNNLS
jgi:hypothetical protein